MGNYERFELDFVERTIALISQYNQLLEANDIPFKQQYNYTLLINCLLGLIVLPRTRTSSYIPNERITSSFKREMGLASSTISPNIHHLRDLIGKLRNSIAHFDFKVASNDENFLIDEIVFFDTEQGVEVEYARFHAAELFDFLIYYSDLLITNLNQYKNSPPG